MAEEKKYPQANYQGQYDQKVRDLYSQMENQKAPSSQYDQKVNDLYNQIAGRQPFQFNADNDALYQQYVDRYMQGGRQAMKDTIGQASALTGGYANSYAQKAGQQAYDQYLTGLNDQAKDLYQMQMQAYQLEGDRLNNLLGTASGLADRDYARANDEYNRLNNLMGTAATLSDSDYNRLFNEAQMRQQLGDDSLLRQLLGMPEQAAGGDEGYYGGGGAYDPVLEAYQKLLNAAGAEIDEDGIEGPQTRNAAGKFDPNDTILKSLLGETTPAPAEKEEKEKFRYGGKTIQGY